MKVQVMVNGRIPPVHNPEIPGRFRDTLYLGKRFKVEITDPEVEQAIEEALDYGFKPEIWIEKICQQ